MRGQAATGTSLKFSLAVVCFVRLIGSDGHLPHAYQGWHTPSKPGRPHVDCSCPILLAACGYLLFRPMLRGYISSKGRQTAPDFVRPDCDTEFPRRSAGVSFRLTVNPDVLHIKPLCVAMDFRCSYVCLTMAEHCRTSGFWVQPVLLFFFALLVSVACDFTHADCQQRCEG